LADQQDFRGRLVAGTQHCFASLHRNPKGQFAPEIVQQTGYPSVTQDLGWFASFEHSSLFARSLGSRHCEIGHQLAASAIAISKAVASIVQFGPSVRHANSTDLELCSFQPRCFA